ncbi:MAG: lysophospholipid acyltransferase family protein [Desulfovermiculus sp.]|nr:lysophospholipid acyltransferase family protein [Desulfovermiculus sp.]
MKNLNFQYLFYLGLGTAIQKMDIQQASWVGHLVGETMWMASASRRKVAIQALTSHLGIDKASATRIARRNFRHTGRSFVEIFLTRHIDFRFMAANVSCNQEQLIQRMIAEKRPIVAITGHLGSWEFLTPILSLRFGDRQRQIIVKHPKDKALAQVMTHCRGVGENQILGKDQAATSVLRCLRHHGLSAFLVDHNTHRNKAIFLPFLGEQAAVNIGPAVLAIRSRALVWPIFLLRSGRGRYTLHAHDPLDTAQLQGKMLDKVTQVSEFYTQAVQKMIRRFPEQWFWMHKRWKTRPVEEKEGHVYEA